MKHWKHTANSQQHHSHAKIAVVVASLAIATALAGVPGYAFAQVSTPPAAQPATKSHSGYQTITTLTGNTHATHPNLVPIDPPGGGIGGPTPDEPEPPQITAQAVDLNTHTHQYTVVLSNGFKAVIDGNSRSITMRFTDPRFPDQVVTVPLREVLLKWAGGNEALAAEREQYVLDILGSKINNSRIAAVDSSHTDTYFMPSGRSGRVPNSTYANPYVIALPPITVIASPLPPYSCWATFTCFYDYHRPQPWQTRDIGYGFWYQAPHGGSAPPGHEHDANYKAWDKWRIKHCTKAAKQQKLYGIGEIGGIASALAILKAKSRVGKITALLAFAVSVVQAHIHYHDYVQNERICKSSYPGVGNWP